MLLIVLLTTNTSFSSLNGFVSSIYARKEYLKLSLTFTTDNCLNRELLSIKRVDINYIYIKKITVKELSYIGISFWGEWWRLRL